MAMTTPTSYDWLKEYLDDTGLNPEDIATLLGLHAFEIEEVRSVGSDTVIDVDVLPNRSSDCLCHRGIAREIATITKLPLKHDPLLETVTLEPKTDAVTISIEDTSACRRFSAALVSGITVKESPQWLKDRLTAIGQRPINNVVDATNYVMFSLGQPLHAYDAKKLGKDDSYHLGVRMAKEGEKVTVLTGEEYELESDVQVITEGSTDTPIGIAGVKGGKYAEISETTTDIVLEAANFDPTITRKVARKLRLLTDASKRFENEISRDTVPYAIKACVELLAEIAGGTCEGYADTYPTTHRNKRVTVTHSHINELLGLALQKEDIEDIFGRLGFTFEAADASWSVMAPFYRTDITIAEDIIEEVGRVHGYEHIEAVVPESVSLIEINKRHYYSEKIRAVLTRLGFSEVITSSFRKKDQISLQNALASDKGCLRSALSKNITEVLDKNISMVDLLGLEDVRVFEIGTIFFKEENGIGEKYMVGLGVRKKQQGYTPKDDVVLGDVIKELEDVLGTSVNATVEKGVAEIDLSALLTQLPQPETYDAFEKQEDVQYRPFSVYPHISRDIALWTEGVSADEVENVLKEHAGDLLVRTTLFDTFEKGGKVSYAFRLVFQSDTKTLTDAEIEPIMEQIYKAVEKLDWEVR